ncbi:MAG: 16S rRNA (guanine(527)-N(7))-methyltransferase RsmG [Lachnospiraceae bacterium]|nr:16S rRNA (guanine(527)-N(7))-methyltransferase RsmG [Lachnospiraceae bacterium]
MKDLTVFNKGLEQLGLQLTDHQKEQFLQYYDLLIEWNSFMNLTGITEFQDVIVKHFLDSLSLVKAVQIQDGQKLIDVGTGAGFPGIPLKIAYPELQVTLLDSLKKRLNFLDEVIARLGLTGIETVHGRAEDAGRNPAYREMYQLCVSRAVANLSSLSEYCLPFVEKGGTFISYKSGHVEEEMKQAKKAIHLLGGEAPEVIYFTLADTDNERSLVTIRKISNTAKKYPRKAGLPVKEPLS